MGDPLNIHTSFGGGDNHGARGGSVDEDGQIVFFGDLAIFGKVDRPNQPAGGTGLMGDQGIPEHSPGKFEGFFLGGSHSDAPFKAIREGSHAAPARMDLSFDDDGTIGKRIHCRLGLFQGVCRAPAGYRNSVIRQEPLGLEFVNIHFKRSRPASRQSLLESVRQPC